MINKLGDSVESALAAVSDGSSVMVGGFGGAGGAENLLRGLIDAGPRDLTVISNNAGTGNEPLRELIRLGRVGKLICSFPKDPESTAFSDLYREGRIALELVPQGTLAERIRAGGAGVPAFYTATAVGTPLAEGRETRVFDGREYLLETALRADFALVRARRADRFGNLTYHRTARNFGPIMCMAARHAVVEAPEIVETIDPESVVTPGIFVETVVRVAC